MVKPVYTCELTAEKEGGIVGPDPVGSVGRLLVHCHILLAKVAVRDHLNSLLFIVIIYLNLY